MKSFNNKTLRKLTSTAYAAGVVSLIIGLLLSFVTQPVYAAAGGEPGKPATATSEPASGTTVPGAPGTPTSTGGPGVGGDVEKIWICHAPPATPAGWTAVYVDAASWTGHSGHAGDFIISGRTDTACNPPAEPTATVDPSATAETPIIPVTGESATPTTQPGKIWICHLPEGNPDNGVSLEVDASGWNGHDLHPGDFEISGPDDPTCGGATPTATAVPTEVPTDTPTPTATATDTPTPTPTDTATPTLVPFARLSLDWICAVTEQAWTVSNTNPVEVPFTWSLSDGSSGSGTVPANSSLTFYTVTGYHTMTLSWLDHEGATNSLSSTTSETSPCPVETPTSEPTTALPTETGGTGGGGPVTQLIIPVTGARQATPRPTFVATLSATADPNQVLLIPVTGAGDNSPFGGSPLGTLFLKFGAVLFGMAFVSQGLTMRYQKAE